MKRIITTIIMLLALSQIILAQEKPQWSLYIKQGGMYYKSDHIISTGVGLGVGAAVMFKKYWMAQSDVNLYWLNGNSVSERLAVGMQKPGKWRPALFVGCNIIGGNRTEFILTDCKRASKLRVVPEIRIAPLRLESDKGFISVCEIGAGIGADKGVLTEISLFTVAVNF
jgi:hypothetical protein